MKAAIADPPSTDDPIPVGEIVAGTYVTERILGRGGSGVVYEARNKNDGSRVALKVIHAELCHSRQIFGRYQREAKILRRIGGAHIVKLLDFVEHEGLLAIALERVEGVSLEKAIEAGISVDRAVDLAAQICEGLALAHGGGVVHRDLKPANVMLEPDVAGRERARILDFGLAKVVHGEHMTTGLTERDMIFGTPEYMAPEQARGDEVDARCDVYACGVILYEMVTGTVPLRGRTPLATMTAQLTEKVPPPRERAPGRPISAALESIILRALEKDRDRRFESALAMGNALRAAHEKKVISVHFDEASGDLSAGDTELNLRKSQLPSANTPAFVEPARSTSAPSPLLTTSADHEKSSWTFVVLAVIAVGGCVALGIWLALAH